MNSIIKLIDERVKANYQNADFIATAPCVVLQVLADNFVQVQMVSDGRVFTLLNGTGVQLAVGDEARVAYRNYISDNNSFVIAGRGHNGISITPTLGTGIAESSEVRIRQTNEGLFINIDVVASADISSGEVSIATADDVASGTEAYYSILRDKSTGTIYPLEARIADGDLSLVVIAGSTITQNTELVGQVFCL